MNGVRPRFESEAGPILGRGAQRLQRGHGAGFGRLEFGLRGPFPGLDVAVGEPVTVGGQAEGDDQERGGDGGQSSLQGRLAPRIEHEGHEGPYPGHARERHPSPAGGVDGGATGHGGGEERGRPGSEPAAEHVFESIQASGPSLAGTAVDG